ncbi:hypothetical protein MANES_02G220870v8 [Manihot esculenta]|uniref:Uncharacterized protein n=1 Tax=Manihot esculenta TaxID=3983 RepID=A0ACB7I9X7_MANES|nr:hypothetical protein MANES_02G220870v8 [Manihot esculenta]
MAHPFSFAISRMAIPWRETIVLLPSKAVDFFSLLSRWILEFLEDYFLHAPEKSG